MNQNELHNTWDKLCDEYHLAKEAQFKAFVAVNQKMTGDSIVTSEELAALDETDKKLHEIQKRMHAFATNPNNHQSKLP